MFWGGESNQKNLPTTTKFVRGSLVYCVSSHKTQQKEFEK